MKILNKISIAWQLTLLAVLIAGAAIWILSQAVLAKGREVLLTHELVDLGDEANLRMYEVRDQIRHLQWELRQVAREVGEVFHDQLAMKIEPAAAIKLPIVSEVWKREWDRVLQNYPAPANDEERWRQDRERKIRRYLTADTIREAYWYQLADETSNCKPLAVWRPGAKQFDFDARANDSPETVKVLATKSFHFDQTPAFSRPQLEPIEAKSKENRCFVSLIVPIWTHDNKVLFALVVRVDLTKYFINMGMRAPRHFFVLTDSQWKVLVHPNPDRVGEHLLHYGEPWRFRVPSPEQLQKQDPWLPPFDTEHELRMMNTAGLRLRSPTLVPGQGGDDPTTAQFDLGERYHYWHTRLDLPPFDPELYASLNELLVQEANRLNQTTYPIFRMVEVNQEFPLILLSHPDAAELRNVQEAVTARLVDWNAKRIEKGEPTVVINRWVSSLKCQKLAAHLVRSRLSSYAGSVDRRSDQDTPFQLIILASVEEIQSDINDAIGEVRLKWGFGVLLGASALALLSALWLTKPLKRITGAAEKLSAGEFNLDLKVQGPTEVNKLATSFQTMAIQIRQRGDELNKNLERLQTILKTAAEGILVFNNHGRILEANLAAVKMFGYESEGEMRDLRADELLELPMQFSDPGQSSIHKKKDGESVHVFDEVLRMPSEIRRGMRADGSTFWIEVGFSKIPSQKLYTGIFRDVSGRKMAEEMRQKAESDLKELNLQLDQRVHERTGELAEATARLELALEHARAAMKAKDTFVANMSHELRQPLHIIIGFTEALRDEMEDEGNAIVVKDLNKIHTAAKHLLDLINDLLDLAKIAAGKMDLSVSEFELPPLIDTLKTLAQPLMEKNENLLSVEVDPDVGKMKSDDRRVKQVLFNLLSNAAKFTSKGCVQLKVQLERESGREGVSFRVIDTGKGMTHQQREMLFQEFYQVDDSTTRSQSGTGLGLAITRSLCNLMKGNIGIPWSEVDQGTEFRVWLPIEVVNDETPLRVPLPDKPVSSHSISLPSIGPVNGVSKSPKVLVVDDDDRVRELMQRFLLKEGFEVLTAANGVDGLRLAKEHHPCVITLDVMMPGIDGWGILAALKTDATTQDIPVVIVSIVDDRNRGFALGASDYINKPIDWSKLGSILRRHIRIESQDPVLVIDDDANVRDLMVRFLEKEGFNVMQAENGQRGLEQFRSRRPAAVLLDINMPVMDGFEFVAQLRKLDPLHQVPVLVLTGEDLSAAQQQLLSGGVSQILQKGEPENLDALLNLLHEEIRNVLASRPPSEEGADSESREW